MSEIPCFCNHLDRDHYKIVGAPRWCEQCFYRYGQNATWQHEYKQDNLKWLEQQVDKNV
jgi:hypothetical protein